MLIKFVKIQPETLIKIYEKHAVLSREIEKVLVEGKPMFRKVGGEQYVAIGLRERYLTIFFKYSQKSKEAEITTAYPSSRGQIRAYKRLKR
ncbi:MAG TPA: hypothetical protein VJH95_02925 [Candidatus Nanoarchaeia archaeon]|nr:hypothetical protein [Candidatus Nanoarchaeia archaeon]